MNQREEQTLINKVLRNEWSQILVVLIGVAGMFLWSSNLMHTSIEAIREDVKDFHGRLCTLEEKYYQMKYER